MKKAKNVEEWGPRWLLAIIALLAVVVAIQHVVIRTLRQQINNYREECGDRTDVPHLACGHDLDGAATSSGGTWCTNQ